jgi:hypothetical protein
MENGNKQGITILQDFAVPGTPLDVSLMGLQASHNYYSTLTTHVDPFVTISTICNTTRMPSQCCLLSIVVPPSFQTSTLN